MGWNKGNENGHYEEPAIDMDTGEEVTTKASEEKGRNKIIRENIQALGEFRGLPFIDMPMQISFYKRLRANGWSDEQIADQFVECVESDYWKTQKEENNKYPSIATVFSRLKNKNPNDED